MLKTPVVYEIIFSPYFFNQNEKMETLGFSYLSSDNAGSIDPNVSVVTGFDQNVGIAGKPKVFSVELRDSEGKPTNSPSTSVSALIKYKENDLPASFRYSAGKIYEVMEITDSTTIFNVTMTPGTTPGSFEATFTLGPGSYEVYVLWTNVLLNGGTPYVMVVNSGIL